MEKKNSGISIQNITTSSELRIEHWLGDILLHNCYLAYHGVLHFTSVQWKYLECAFCFYIFVVLHYDIILVVEKDKVVTDDALREFQQVANVKTLSLYSSKTNKCFSHLLKLRRFHLKYCRG